MSQTTKSCLALLSSFAKGKSISEGRGEVFWPTTQMCIYSKKSYLELGSYLMTKFRYSSFNGSSVWDNNQFILYYDSVAKCSHEYKRSRLRTSILWSCREQWLLKWNPHSFPCCIIFSASPNISFESEIYVCVYGCVCVCIRKRVRERDFIILRHGFCLFSTVLMFNFL